MWFYFPGMFRALFGRSFAPSRRLPQLDVYVLHVDVRSGGKLYFLFTQPVPALQLGGLVNRLSGMSSVVGGSIDVTPRSLTVEWAPFAGTAPLRDYLIGEIRLEVFEALLGTWEPRSRQWNIMSSDLKNTIGQIGRQHKVDWAGELGLQMS